MLIPGGNELLILAVYFFVVVGTVLLARHRGRSAWAWGLLAFFFFVIATLVLALLPARGPRTAV